MVKDQRADNAVPDELLRGVAVAFPPSISLWALVIWLIF